MSSILREKKREKIPAGPVRDRLVGYQLTRGGCVEWMVELVEGMADGFIFGGRHLSAGEMMMEAAKFSSLGTFE